MRYLSFCLALFVWILLALPALAEEEATLSFRVVETPISREVKRTVERREERIRGRRVLAEIERSVAVERIRVDTIQTRVITWVEHRQVNKPVEERVWGQTGVEMDPDQQAVRPVYGWITRRIDPNPVDEAIRRERIDERVVASEIRVVRRPLGEKRKVRPLNSPSGGGRSALPASLAGSPSSAAKGPLHGGG
ncbi:MAG: hypothetical protein VKO64_05430 [Candidatus Sericytochromatia bacterium]|nr:hypothetical protein [Candidatus Sericytochromatia bacterium]